MSVRAGGCERGVWSAVFGCVVAMGVGVEATPLTVVNPGFEDIGGESVVNEFTFGPLNGWGLYDPEGITGGGAGGTYFIGTLRPFEPDPVGEPGVYAFFDEGAIEGERVGIAFNFAGSGGEGAYGLEQTLVDELEALRRYRLTVEIGNIGSGTSLGGGFFPLDGFPGYRVDLLAGGVVVASDVNTLAGSIPDGGWGTSSLVFTSGSSVFLEGEERIGQSLGIRLVNLNEVDASFPGSDLEVDFDDVRLEVLLAADFNGDLTVDLIDLSVLATNFDTGAGRLFAEGDANGDGLVDLIDLSVLATLFGQSDVVLLPEPGVVGLMVGLGVLVGRRGSVTR
ncbi:MAG: hypothetical protein RIG82_00215 [Phycisphaeraceae bacterium]